MSKTNAPLKIGLIGAGGIVRGAHLNPGWTAVPNAEIVAVADISLKTAEALAKDFKIPNAYEDFNKLLEHDEIDAVDICTPNRVHTPAVLAALAAGKHVMCEKPLAVTTEEVKQMAAAAEKSGKILMTAQHQRFSAISTAIKRWVDAGNLGDVYHTRVHAVRRNLLPISVGFIVKELSGGGPCMDIGVHALDLAMHMMGHPRPTRVTGTSKVNFAKGDVIPGAWGEWDREKFSVEDFAAGFVHFENGATMVLEASWLQHQKEVEDMSSRMYGTKGSVTWPSGEFSTAINRVNLDGVIQPVQGLRPAHTEEIFAFARAITEGLSSPVPVSQTLSVIGILEGLMQSSVEGREVTLSL
ncbi:oxidoreductase [Verrucomicrobia bacterium LW23]|nr:oxidoreductase [Verrucomicrobia bacterium LW23]